MTGSVVFKPLVRLARNMVVLRHAGELTLINSVRLDPAGLAALEALGRVAHVMRIGFHGMDDAFYLDRYGAKAWVVRGARREGVGEDVAELSEEAALPFPLARVFLFKATVQLEAALLVEREGGLLITCDSVQHWEASPLMSPLAKLATLVLGFRKPAQIGPPWRKRQTPPGGSLRGDFERLASLPFVRLIGGHGGVLESRAQELLQATIDRELGAG